MRLAATFLIIALMTGVLSGACTWLGLPHELCGLTALVGWSVGLLALVRLWAEVTERADGIFPARPDGLG